MLDEDRALVSSLAYDPETGATHWKVSKKGKKVGFKAGRVGSQGYVEIRTMGRTIRVHRLAFLLMEGRWPAGVVDHINGDASDNRWINLRECTQGQNCQNQKLAKDNPVGLKGVSRCRQKWQAMIQKDGANIYLGLFETPELAHAAYVSAARVLHGDFARAS